MTNIYIKRDLTRPKPRVSVVELVVLWLATAYCMAVVLNFVWRLP